MSRQDKHQQSLWYTRRGELVQGPFPPGQIARYVILGRVLPTDEVSMDRQTWVPVSQVPELVPSLLQPGGDDPAQEQRLQAAKRWEDERSRDRRHDEATVDADHRRTDRRQVTEPGAQRPRGERPDPLRERIEERRRHHRLSALIAVGVLLILGLLVVVYRPATKIGAVGLECAQQARPGVDWSNCAFDGRGFARADLSGARMTNMRLSRADLSATRLERADLSYSDLAVARLRDADLSGAVLTGANLRAAELVGARFVGADLSYADLTGADLTGADLSGAKLDNTLWVDGRVCARGSVGRCESAGG